MKINEKILNMEEHVSPNESSERTLWTAVIERAMKDYCFFFDWVESSSRIYKKRATDKLQNIRCVNFVTKSIGEFNRLQWFLFSNEMQPFNLYYITEQLHDDSGLRERLRTMAREQFKLNLDKAIAGDKFPAITSYILKNTNAHKETPAAAESTLRQKRYRIIFD